MNYEYCGGIVHEIRQGDTLYQLSREYSVPLALLLRANPYVDVYNLQVGDTLCIPRMMPGTSGTWQQKPEKPKPYRVIKLSETMDLEDFLEKHDIDLEEFLKWNDLDVLKLLKDAEVRVHIH